MQNIWLFKCLKEIYHENVWACPNKNIIIFSKAIMLHFPSPDIHFLKGFMTVWIQGARDLLFRTVNCRTTLQNTYLTTGYSQKTSMKCTSFPWRHHILSPGPGGRVLNPTELTSARNLQNKKHDFTGEIKLIFIWEEFIKEFWTPWFISLLYWRKTVRKVKFLR